jgi:hypothetical protein
MIHRPTFPSVPPTLRFDPDDPSYFLGVDHIAGEPLPPTGDHGFGTANQLALNVQNESNGILFRRGASRIAGSQFLRISRLTLSNLTS